VARPLRFRHSTDGWTAGRVRSQVLDPLDANLGASEVPPRFDVNGPWETHRFAVDNGDVALFARGDGEAYWMGNTETPSSLWRTEKVDWSVAPYAVGRWAQRELLADLHDAEPWLAEYPHLSWFFLPVLMSKDGRHTTRRFFREHAAGFPDADRGAALEFYESFLRTGTLDPYRELMAGKLGTSEYLDAERMGAAMAEFTAAKLLVEAGYDVRPDPEMDSGHTLDFAVTGPDGREGLVEVTRPSPPADRAANSPARAVTETVATKAGDQLAGRDALLLVDCSSFPPSTWRTLCERPPDPPHQPALLYRATPDGVESLPVGNYRNVWNSIVRPSGSVAKNR
jgi:hypothetical protein